MNKINVLFLTNIPSPYMVGYLNELGRYVNLKVLFEKAYDSTRPDSWKKLLSDIRFEVIILKSLGVSRKLYNDKMGSAPNDKALSFEVCKHLKERYDFIIVANPCTPTGMVAIIYMQIHHIRYSIQSEGGVPGLGKGLKEKLKYLLMRKADYYFSTCDMDDEYFYLYGADKKQIRRYPFASISESELPEKFVSKKQRELAKDKLGIKYQKMILSVGRSVYVKGFDLLLKAFTSFPKGTCLYFVGGECTREYRQIIKQYRVQNVFFVDNVDFDTLKYYYMAADVFILPTRSDTWGLVINEAMAYGLPIITTTGCVAGNALIKNGQNGYVVEKENIEALKAAMINLLSNERDQVEFGKNNYELIKTWTFEEMGRVVFGHIKQIVSAN